METDKLSEALGIDPLPLLSPATITAPVASNAVVDTMDTDIEYVRQNLYDVISKTSEAVDQLMQISRESQHPRAYEVLAQLLKNQADTAHQIVDLHKKKKDIQKQDSLPSNPANTNMNVQNAVFVGTTAELLKIMKRNDQPVIEGTIVP